MRLYLFVRTYAYDGRLSYLFLYHGRLWSSFLRMHKLTLMASHQIIIFLQTNFKIYNNAAILIMTGPMHMMAAYLTFFSIMNDYGFPPWTLFGTGYTFAPSSTWGVGAYPGLICTTNELGEALECGYGCPLFDWTPGKNINNTDL